MSDALGSGWLVALILGVPAFATAVLVPFGKWLAARWREPLAEEVRARNALQERLDEMLERLSDERVRRIYLEAKVESCERELENWRSGKWSR